MKNNVILAELIENAHIGVHVINIIGIRRVPEKERKTISSFLYNNNTALNIEQYSSSAHFSGVGTSRSKTGCSGLLSSSTESKPTN